MRCNPGVIALFHCNNRVDQFLSSALWVISSSLLKKFQRKPLSRRIYGDRGQVSLAAADWDELGIARLQAARHNRLQRRSKNSTGRRILKDQSPEQRPFDNREVGGGILWD